MKLDWSFPRQILLAIAVIVAVGIYPLMVFGTRQMLVASSVGAALMTVNVLLGYFAIEYSFEKSTTIFLQYVLGGMTVRMFCLAGILVVLIKVCELHVGALVASMGIFYAVFLSLEILYIQKKVDRKHHT